MFEPIVIKKAFQSVWRNDTIARGGKQHAGIIRKLAHDLRKKGDRLSVKYNKDIPTACWSIDGNFHLIQVGMTGWKEKDFLPKVVKEQKRQIDFTKLVMRHESGHALYSNEKGMLPSDVGAECKAQGVPYRLWNLFEDCFIENKLYLEEKKRFSWHNFMQKCSETTTPSRMLLEMKQREAASKSGWRCHLPRWLGSASVTFEGKLENVSDLVVYFFKQSLTGTAFDRVTLAKRWVSVFGDEVPTEYVDGEVGSSASTPSGSTGKKTAVRTNTPYRENPGDGWRTGHLVSPVSILKRDRIARSLSQLIKNASYSRSQISNQGSRLNLKNAIHRMDGSFKSIKKVNGKRKILLIVDQSSSMINHWQIQGGKEFVSAWKRVGEIGLANVQIIYSSAGKREDVSRKHSDTILSDCPASGGEGLQKCCQEHRAAILGSDVAIIYTDGGITDGDIDLKPFRASTRLIGACLHEEGYSYAYKMERWFDSVALRTTAEALATQICRLVLKR